MSWKEVLRHNFTSVQKLADFLKLSDAERCELDIHPRFVLNLPRRLAEKIQKQTLDDPLFKQFVPLKKEKILSPSFLSDPVQDVRFQKEAKLLHKYETRTLIIATSACAMHCRYCFRQNFPYETKTHSFDNEIAYLERHSSIQEVILSGGDPLSLPDETLKNLFDALAAIDHIKIVRFHSRFLMGVPERIDESFIRLLKQFPKQIVFVLHANHPNEFDDDVWSAIKQIQLCGIPTLNQSVLLRGVNDSASIQEALSMQLISHGVIPYYLHQLDPVQGASHFEVAIEQGRAIIDELRSRLPGYAVPKYVAEIPGKPSKTAL